MDKFDKIMFIVLVSVVSFGLTYGVLEFIPDSRVGAEMIAEYVLN